MKALKRSAAKRRAWRVEDILPSDDEDAGPSKKRRKQLKQVADDPDYESESDEEREKTGRGRGRRPGFRSTKTLVRTAVPQVVPRGEGGANSRWQLLMSYGKELWPTLAAGRSELKQVVMNNLLRLDAMRHAKWFKELPYDCSGLDPIELSTFKITMRNKAMYLATDIIAEGKSFVESCFSDLAFWIEFCEKEHEGDLAVDNIEKVRAFIPFRIACAMDNRSRSSRQRALEEETAFNTARFVPPRIGKLAEVQGYFRAKELTEHEAISTLIEEYRLKAVQARAQPRDFAGSSRVITKDINEDEDVALKKTYWSGLSSRNLMSMRSYLLYMVNSTAGRRGHEFREMYMGMLMMRTVTSIEPVEGNVIVASIRHVKNCTKNLEHIITWIRHENPFDCPTGALANYFTYIADIDKHPVFSVIEDDLNRQIAWARRGKTGEAPKSKWWGLRFVYTNDTNYDRSPFYDEISDTTHADGILKALAENGITGKSAVTHLQRHKVLIDNTEKGVPVTDSAKYQLWRSNEVSSAIDFYLNTAIKTKPLLVAHGWKGLESYQCWRQTKESEIPEDLLSHVFPDLDRLMTLAKTAYSESGLDLSAIEFFKMLKYLRRVFLEDAVYMIDEYPEFPAFEHPVFRTSEWREWKEQAVIRVEQMSQTHAMLNKDVDMGRVMSLMRNHNARMEKRWEQAAAQLTAVAMAAPRTEPVTPPPMEVPGKVNLVPHIMGRILNLKTLYKEWDTVLRPYFSNNGNPPWLETFGQGQQAHKTRYVKLENTCLYIDYVATNSGKDPWKIVGSLEKVAKRVGEDHHKFVTQCMYGLIQLTGQANKRVKTAEELALENALAAEGLPIPTMPAKELRIALQWKNRGVLAKRKAAQAEQV